MVSKAWGGTGRILNGLAMVGRVGILCTVDGLAVLAVIGAVVFWDGGEGLVAIAAFEGALAIVD